MNTPFWFKLVHAWRLKGRTGVTLPFIVGADARARRSIAKEEDVRRILSEIRAYQSPNESLAVRWCPDRRALVICVEPFPNRAFMVDETLAGGDGSRKTQVLDSLAHESEALVREGNFSRVGDPPEWASFEEDDLKFIDSVIESRR